MLGRLATALATDEIASLLLRLESVEGVWNAALSIDALYPERGAAPSLREHESGSNEPRGGP